MFKKLAVGLLVAAIAGYLLLSPVGAQTYTPQTRDFTVVTPALMTTELAKAIPSYDEVVNKAGEVYVFYPDVLTVYQGDTVNITLVNLQPDDPHTFTMSAPYDKVDITVGPNDTAKVSFVASSVGTFEFYCIVAKHLPYMYGELVVLPDSMGGGYQNK
jgi:plastocyanin